MDSPNRRALRMFLHNRPAKTGLTVVALIVTLAAFAGILSPYSPEAQSPLEITLGPSLSHWFGTDSLGRDLFTRILFGSRVSLAVALVTAVIGTILGALYGGLAGMVGGKIDAALMRGLDFFYTLPTLLLIIFINAVLGQGLFGILVALSLEGVMTIARLVRGQVLQLKGQEFVVAAEALGASRTSILVKHLIPNIFAPLVVTLTYLIPANIMYEAFLSFVGLGIQPPYSS